MKPRGRPREVENPIRVTVRVSALDYDRLEHVARDFGLTVAAFIRQAAISASLNTDFAAPTLH